MKDALSAYAYFAGWRIVRWLPERTAYRLAYSAADFVIGRSGAMTVAELTAVGLPACFIPLPIGNGEQRFNASHVIEQGRGELIEQSLFSAAWLASNLNRLLSLADGSPIAGSGSDLQATEKIVNFMEHAHKARVS